MADCCNDNACEIDALRQLSLTSALVNVTGRLVHGLQRERGDARVVFKPTPIPAHPNSAQAALAAFCAHEQPNFLAYHALLFEQQATWRAGGNATLLALAANASLDTEQFGLCFAQGRYSEDVERFRAEGRAVGIYGTPTFFVNGRPLVGPQPLGAFS